MAGGKVLSEAVIPVGYHPEMEELVALPLTNESVVFVVGAFEGLTVKLLWDTFQPTIYAFDPQSWVCVKTEALVPEARVFHFGLGHRTGVFRMHHVGNDACSFVHYAFEKFGSGLPLLGRGQMRDVAEVFQELNVGAIDLLFLNCEGAEFLILPRMIEENLLLRCRFVCAQMHGGNEEADAHYETVCSYLDDHYQAIWDLRPSWAIWERR